MVLALTLALGSVHSAHARQGGGRFTRNVGKAAAEGVGEVLAISAAVVGGLTIIGLTTWYFVAHHRKEQEVSSVSDAARLATADVARCAEVDGGPAVACW
jgi:hypothetical protein